MQEYEIYLPTTQREGKRIPSAELDRIKQKLKDAFGGYTEIERCQGTWKAGGRESRDRITILRVLDDGSSGFDMKGFRLELEQSLQQDRLLITVHDVEVV